MPDDADFDVDLTRVFDDQHGRTRLVLREGPHPAGMAEGGRQAWESMFSKLDTLLEGLRRPA
jgi:hypothetical protein